MLPLIEGTTVNTKYGPVKTDHILFIASGAFQLAKPSDLLPELQGRLPIRVELEALTSDDFKRILKEPDYSLIKQYVALLKTENVDLEFSEDGIDAIANIASEVNSTVENIGARRLHTIIEKILDDCIKSIIETTYNIDYEIIVVDDCIKDKTAYTVEEIIKKQRFVKLIRNSSNFGYGGAFKEGLKFATKKYCTIIPGDGETNVKLILKTIFFRLKSKIYGF